jgi:glycosyltransferase involved in cell wall biosynthesis
MKLIIGIMMRAMDQDSGFRAYTEGLVENMLMIDHENIYVLFYRTKKHFGRFSSYPNVKEVYLNAPHKFVWDQISVPSRAWKEKVDIIFNPKFSVPLVSHCPVAMGLQEPAWWTEPEYYPWFNVLYNKTMLPLYCRKASQIFPMSNFILGENRKYLGLPLGDAIVTHTVPGPQFRPIQDTEFLEKIRTKHGLPERFIFNPTRVDHPGLDNSTSFFGGKNPDTTLRAFLLCREEIPHELVFAGRRVREYFLHLGFQEKDFERVRFVGFVSLEDLAGLYNLAELVVIPSFYEGCPATVMQAMACGSPLIASATGGSPEVSGDAALLADPHDPADVAKKMKDVLSDENLKKELKAKGLERASFFNWQRTAKLTLGGLVRAARKTH